MTSPHVATPLHAHHGRGGPTPTPPIACSEGRGGQHGTTPVPRFPWCQPIRTRRRHCPPTSAAATCPTRPGRDGTPSPPPPGGAYARSERDGGSIPPKTPTWSSRHGRHGASPSPARTPCRRYEQHGATTTRAPARAPAPSPRRALPLDISPYFTLSCPPHALPDTGPPWASRGPVSAAPPVSRSVGWYRPAELIAPLFLIARDSGMRPPPLSLFLPCLAGYCLATPLSRARGRTRAGVTAATLLAACTCCC